MTCVDETAENIDIHSPDGTSGSGLTALQWLTFFDATSRTRRMHIPECLHEGSIHLYATI